MSIIGGIVVDVLIVGCFVSAYQMASRGTVRRFRRIFKK